MKYKKVFCTLFVIILGLSVFFTIVPLINAASTAPELSIVQDGTTSGIIPTMAVGSTFKVDVYLNNTSSVTPGINCISLTVAWNQSIINCTAMNDGTYLPDQANLGDLGPYYSGQMAGTCTFGLNCFDPSNPQLAAPNGASGIVGTLTFQVLSSGSSNITIEPQGLNVPYLDYPTSTTEFNAVSSVTVLYGVYGTSTTTPPPSGTYAPTAIIKIANGTVYTTGSPIPLDGSPSTGGQDGSYSCPIQSWSWLAQFQNGTIFGAYSGENVTVVINASALLKITLVVTAPDTNPQPSSQYTNSSATFIWINVELPSQITNLNVCTNKETPGSSPAGGTFYPQDYVQVYANVTTSGAAVANAQVTFVIENPSSAVISVITNTTNTQGTAYTAFRLPWLDNNTADFGIWTILTSVEISQNVFTNTLQFQYSNVTTLVISVPSSISRGSALTINATIPVISGAPATSMVTFTLYDSEQVPIDFYMANLTSAVNNVISATVTIPSWAFTGAATVYVNVITNSPTAGGVPLISQQSATFQVTS